MGANSPLYSPCKGCETRHFNCHATCEGYNEFKQRKAEENERRRAAAAFVDFDVMRLQRVIKHNQKYHKRFR